MIPLDRNTNLLVETTSSTSINCGQSVANLVRNYFALTASKSIRNQDHLSIEYAIGQGNQGIVFYTEQIGDDGFRVPIALKILSPSGYMTVERYTDTMLYSAKVAAAVGKIQHDGLLTVRNWFILNGVRLMEMEWIDGYDLDQLMKNSTIEWMQQMLSPEDFEHRMDVVISPGPIRPTLKAGVALTIIRHCLDALSALHENGIVHGDIKPANIMLKKSGGVKIIDYGATFFYGKTPPLKLCTPLYAAPEIFSEKDGCNATPQSDLASLGYVLIELLSGRSPFECTSEDSETKYISTEELTNLKINLVDHLEGLLPEDIRRNQMIIDFLIRLIHPDLSKRYPSAKEAIVDPKGIGEILRSLVKADLASDFDVDIKSWISSLELPRKSFKWSIEE